MNQVSDIIPKFSEATATEQAHLQEPKSRWVTALYVQFRVSSGDYFESCDLLDQCHAILERAVSHHKGDVVALSKDAALAVFTSLGHRHAHTQDAVDAAASILHYASNLNKMRLAQDLVPLRLGIGLDAGLLSATNCNRHPRLDPGLQPFLNRARRLSELNYQAPFPAIFVSHAVADRLDHCGRYAVQNLGDVFVDEHSGPLAVYAVMKQEGVWK